jgi:hypothetical protein
MSPPKDPEERIRRLARVSDEQLSDLTGSEGCERLLDAIRDSPAPERATRRSAQGAAVTAGFDSSSGRGATPLARIVARMRRLPVPILLGAGLAAAGATGAGAWALTNGSSTVRNTTAIACKASKSVATGINPVSGDPIRDCRAIWRIAYGHAAPRRLRAYAGKDGDGFESIIVQPATMVPPPGTSRLRARDFQNVALIELRESLNDYVSGLNSGCYDSAEAERLAERDLERLDITGWQVKPRGQADGRTSCMTTDYTEPGSRTVRVMEMSHLTPDYPGNHPYTRLAQRLRRIERTCQPLPVAKRQVKAAVAATDGVRDSAYSQAKIVPNKASCTTIHELVGGGVDLILRGPRH